MGTIGVEPYHGNSRSANMQSTVISINTIRQPDSIASILQTKPLEPHPLVVALTPKVKLLFSSWLSWETKSAALE